MPVKIVSVSFLYNEQGLTFFSDIKIFRIMFIYMNKEYLNPIRFRPFLLFKGPAGVFMEPLKISGTTEGSRMKLSSVIELLKVCQNT